MKIYEKTSISLSDVTDLRKFGNKIGDIDNIEEIVNNSFELISNKINPQVISVFLFSKDGDIERFRIYGKDKDGAFIENNWLSDEKYSPGDSFSGKAAKSDDSKVSPYGIPHINNSLDLDKDYKLKYGQEYIDKLGFLSCGISVPLNGSKRTFGTIEVINKLENGIPCSSQKFNEDEFGWLTITASHVSSAITRVKNSRKSDVYARISRTLAYPYKTENASLYKSITDYLIGEMMPYKSCILRTLDNNSLYIVEQSNTPGISIKPNTPRSLSDKSMVADVAKSGKRKIVDNINEKSINSFLSKDWIEANNLKSFICLPLCAEDDVLGTISLFSGYSHSFTRNDVAFLENISYLLACYQLKTKVDSRKTRKNKLRENQSSNVDLTKDSILKSIRDSFERKSVDFRTVGGISNDLDLEPSLVREILEANTPKFFRKALVTLDNGENLYCPSNQPISWRERFSELKVLLTKPVKRDVL